ncbi:hypothetical protein CSOJ01_14570 [Colletotrichum sojae]|uniref:Biotrophy-associated secreted protein 2 n=1 Tax=Colletotrichum sojae TaxID=2175907 RepID=A0A8H6MJZ4_9PEZI|nr:hypothetical protein CSOJ01_14570 [Colletotrichum sojae]
MLVLRILLIALTGGNLVSEAAADDPSFCNNVAVCTPCNCNTADRCAGFCHHDNGNTGPKQCTSQSLGCTCPAGWKLIPGGRIVRRGGCMSVGARGGAGGGGRKGGKVGPDPPGACGQVGYSRVNHRKRHARAE